MNGNGGELKALSTRWVGAGRKTRLGPEKNAKTKPILILIQVTILHEFRAQNTGLAGRKTKPISRPDPGTNWAAELPILITRAILSARAELNKARTLGGRAAAIDNILASSFNEMASYRNSIPMNSRADQS